ncbi:MAG: DNA translocase FtsK [Saccharofermentans sp.]|nr:DNA translocase FtsK [Saccharofermentans sp.]
MSRFENKKEILGLVLFFLAAAIILIFYLPVSLTGIIGSFVKNVFFGLIGCMAYAIPLYVLYVALDVFFEKREGVSGVRVRSVILLLVSFASLLAMITMDFDYFREISATENGSVSALKALGMLWQSGGSQELICRPGSPTVFPGGLVGGAIAVALNEVTGKIIAILANIVFIITQIILVFRVSLKATARKTYKAISNASNKVYKTVVAKKGPRNEPGFSIYSGKESFNRPARPQGTPARQGGAAIIYGDNSAPATAAVPTRSRRPAAPAAKPLGPSPYGRPDAFDSSLPIDSRTGFVDVARMTGDANAVGRTDPGKLTYNEKEYNVRDGESPVANFEYTADAVTIPGMMNRKQPKVPDFLDLDRKEPDFYDLTRDDVRQPSHRSDNYEELNPYEVDDDTEGTGYDYTNEAERRVRRPDVDLGALGGSGDESTDEFNMPAPAPAPVKSDAPSNGRITINAGTEDTENFSRTEGRIMKTNENPAHTRNPNVEFSAETQEREKAKKARDSRLRKYTPAPTSLLSPDEVQRDAGNKDAMLREKAYKLEDALRSFGIEAEVKNITHGPAITRFELTLKVGTKVSRVTQLENDIKLAMAAVSIRIEAPIPGKSAIGIEIPNDKPTAVHLRGLVETKEFKAATPLTVALGRDIPGRPIYCDLAKMPHLMIAGSTGSGKSVCINSILTSILVHTSPKDVRMILVDPKVVELAVYNGIPHLIMPVITDPKKAAAALNWAVVEMQRRYKLFAEGQVRNISGFNEKYANDPTVEHLPFIVLVIDELAELMSVAAKEVETYISRLAALARAAGIHLLIATQRPSVDVITGVIKANIGSRIAFAVTSGVDSKTILDHVGAEKLLGKGDMLYAPMSAPQPVRGQGAFLKDEEVEVVVEYLKNKYGSMYDEDIINEIDRTAEGAEGGAMDAVSGGDSGASNDLFEQAVETVIENGSASVSVLQRRLGIGYPRAARLIDELEKKQIIGPFEGSKPRKILVTKTEWLEIKARKG